MNKGKIYISGKVTGMEEEAKILFKKAQTFLEDEGYTVINPMELPANHNKTWRSYMLVCLEALIRCDAIYMLNNHNESPGAKIELDVANALEIDVIYQRDFVFPTEELLINQIIENKKINEYEFLRISYKFYINLTEIERDVASILYTKDSGAFRRFTPQEFDERVLFNTKTDLLEKHSHEDYTLGDNGIKLIKDL